MSNTYRGSYQRFAASKYREADGSIDLTAVRNDGNVMCDQCQSIVAETFAHSHWLQVKTPTYEHWFCWWGCLRDYCNVTVVDKAGAR